MLAQLIHTPRLQLIAATPTSLQAELEEPTRLSDYLRAELPADWPPGEYDRSACQHFFEQLQARGEAAAGWYGWYALYGNVSPSLVGCGGYFGPPDEDGRVEIGYSLSEHWRGQGFATEIVRALVGRIAGHAPVKRIVAHAHPENLASRKVLQRTGFRQMHPSDQEDACLFEYQPN
ncbi:GNAT family N-acetyltransferase [Hymenobacter busanensis]|uniref:GNAT family N-acetyltransferase n=1 Tax=Hymenobacter busanensis TaxID=2607656 RepID=A0A7L5A1N7_9BACT|nr:GNAT family N-acetyltransferase [Hymenobacter busanensis]KAA9338184.1 GNAT family N-acetyltransferase [Hymenobacter busanensis]QHJ09391.1 GNAT family N-acetyltransferase [Hymenobacter busanensis]